MPVATLDADWGFSVVQKRGCPMLAMFTPTEIAAVLTVFVLFLAGLAGVAFLVYFLIRKATRDGARDAARLPPPK
jgi:hypothetical protein